MDVLDVGQQMEGFGAVGAIAQAGGTFGAKSVYVCEFLFKSKAVEKEQGIESLVLCGGRNPFQSQMRQEGLDFGL
jgi:hypothetical protein